MKNVVRVAYRRARIVAASLFFFLLLFCLAILHWGGYLLVRTDVLPTHVSGAVILQASLDSENARIAGAVHLLQQGVISKVLLSIPKAGYWGISFPDLARTYLEKQYGRDVASHFEFCETSPGTDSTEQEAQAIMPCIKQNGWKSIIVVTSNFHSRRAGMVWQRTWKRVQPGIQIWVDGVPDPAFMPQGWWRHRRYAKTWFFESTKLLWYLIFG